MTESPSEAYERGTTAGAIEARLAGHDKHFARINGSIERLATELHDLNLNIQRLSDQAVARDATTSATAIALKNAEQARRDKSQSTWTPFARIAVALSTIGGVIGIALAVYANAHH